MKHHVSQLFISQLFQRLLLVAIASCQIPITTSSADTLIANGTSISIYVDALGAAVPQISASALGLYYDSWDKKLYYSTSTGEIVRTDRDGKNPVTLFDTNQRITDLVVNHNSNKIIWASPDEAAIVAGNLDGSGSPSYLYFGISFPHSIVLEPVSDTLYFIGDGAILTAAADGSSFSPTVLFASVDSPTALKHLTFHQGRLYWVDSTAGKLHRVFVDGTGHEALVTNATDIQAVGYDSTLDRILYIGAPSSGTGLSKVRTNGQSKETIASTVTGYDIIPNYIYSSVDPTQPPVPAAIQTENSIFIAAKDNSSERRYIYRVNPAGEKTQIYDFDEPVSALAYSSALDKLFVATTAGKIFTMKYDGTGFERFNSDSVTYAGHNIRGLALDDDSDTLLISSATTNTIYKGRLSNSNSVESHVTGRTGLAGISLFKNPYEASPRIITAESGRIATKLLNQAAGSIVTNTFFSGINIATAQAPGKSATSDEAGNVPYHLIVANSDNLLTIYDSNVPGPVAGFHQITEFQSVSGLATFSIRKKDGFFDTKYLIAEQQDVKVWSPTLPSQRHTFDFISVASQQLKAICTGRVLSLIGAKKVGAGTGGGTNIPGQVGGAGGSGGSAVGPTATNTVIVYLKPKSATGSSVLVDTRTTTTDADGNYLFADVPAGDYTISFERSDRAFTVPEFEISTDDLDSEVPITYAIPLAAKTGCSWGERLTQLDGANKKAAALYAYALKQAQAVKTASNKLSGSAKTKLTNLVSTTLSNFATLYSAVLDETAAMPSVVLVCSTDSGCSSINYNARIKSYNSKSKKLGTAIKNFVGKAQKQLGAKKNLNASAVSGRIDKLLLAISKISKNLPVTAAECPED